VNRRLDRQWNLKANPCIPFFELLLVVLVVLVERGVGVEDGAARELGGHAPGLMLMLVQ